MSPIVFAHIFEFWVGVIFLVVLFGRLWPSYRLDSFRQQMFMLRDELFDYAAAGNIDFNDPAYRLLRQSMNGLIRYAHQLTFFRLCCTFEMWRNAEEELPVRWSASWEKALKNIKNTEAQNKLNEFHVRSLMLAVERIVTGSPVLIVGVSITLVGLVIHKGWRNLAQACKTAISQVGFKFVDTKMLEEEAARMAA